MEFPAVKHLVSATFDALNYHEPPESSKSPPIAPQPVAESGTLQSEENTLGMASTARDSTNRVGTVLNTVA